MNRLFSLEGRLFQILSRITDLILLNVLWLITSLPVITIGASTTALYSVTLKMVRNEESYIAQSYLRSFRQNLRQSTAVWLGFLLAASVLYYDYYICGLIGEQASAHAGSLLKNLIGILALFLAGGFCYLFPVLARFHNTSIGTVKNAFLMALAHLPYTAALLLLLFAPVLLMLRYPALMIAGIFFYLFIGAALTALAASWLLRRVFDRYTLCV